MNNGKGRRLVGVAAGLTVMGGLALYGGIAGATPQPTVAQVQARINQLTSQFDKVSVQLDQANAQFQAAQASVAQSAAAAFEDTGATSVLGVLTSGGPSAVLRQGSLLMEL